MKKKPPARANKIDRRVVDANKLADGERRHGVVALGDLVREAKLVYDESRKLPDSGDALHGKLQIISSAIGRMQESTAELLKEWQELYCS